MQNTAGKQVGQKDNGVTALRSALYQQQQQQKNENFSFLGFSSFFFARDTAPVIRDNLLSTNDRTTNIHTKVFEGI